MVDVDLKPVHDIIFSNPVIDNKVFLNHLHWGVSLGGVLGGRENCGGCATPRIWEDSDGTRDLKLNLS